MIEGLRHHGQHEPAFILNLTNYDTRPVSPVEFAHLNGSGWNWILVWRNNRICFGSALIVTAFASQFTVLIAFGLFGFVEARFHVSLGMCGYSGLAEPPY